MQDGSRDMIKWNGWLDDDDFLTWRQKKKTLISSVTITCQMKENKTKQNREEWKIKKKKKTQMFGVYVLVLCTVRLSA